MRIQSRLVLLVGSADTIEAHSMRSANKPKHFVFMLCVLLQISSQSVVLLQPTWKQVTVKRQTVNCLKEVQWNLSQWSLELGGHLAKRVIRESPK